MSDGNRFHNRLTVPLQSLTAGKLPAVWAVQRGGVGVGVHFAPKRVGARSPRGEFSPQREYLPREFLPQPEFPQGEFLPHPEYPQGEFLPQPEYLQGEFLPQPEYQIFTKITQKRVARYESFTNFTQREWLQMRK